MFGVNGTVLSMAAIRVLSASIELTAAGLMLYFGRVDQALRINGILGLAGPIILVAVTVLGLTGMAGKISYYKMTLVFIGVYLIIIGTR